MSLTACSGGGDDDPDVLGVAVERSSTTTTEAPSSTTTSEPTTTTVPTTAAPATAAPTTAPATAPAPTTAPPAAPPPPAPTTTTTTPPPPTTQAVTGRYTSPDGTGKITIELMDGAGKVLASQPSGPSGGDFAFAVDPGTYRIQITDVAPSTSEHRTSGTVITRTESFTLEAGRSARFECHVRTGCTGGVR